MKILILCTGNSCRSQIAEGVLKSFSNDIEVHSAGTDPSNQTHPKAIIVMKEIGIDISKSYPKDIDEFIDNNFNYVITVCDNAKETCPTFSGKVKHKLHKSFEDPAEAKGSEIEILNVFRKIRNEIRTEFKLFFEQLI